MIGRDYFYDNTFVTSASTYVDKICVNVGGAMFITCSDVVLVRCTFDGNRAESGAALFIERKSKIELNMCSFQNSQGSVIDANDSHITDCGSSYQNNSADLGAVFYVLYSNISSFGSKFVNNTAKNKGGVIFMYESDITLTESVAIENSAQNGGVVYQLLGSLIITNSSITQNVACNIGVINSEGQSVIINESTFSFNRAHLGMIFLSKVDSFNISNTNITHNKVSTKGVIYAQNVVLKGSGKLIIEHNTANLSIVYAI